MWLCFTTWFAIGLHWGDSKSKCVKIPFSSIFIKLFKKCCHIIRNVSIFRTLRGFLRQNNITDYNITTDVPHIHASVNGQEVLIGACEGRCLLSWERLKNKEAPTVLCIHLFHPVVTLHLPHRWRRVNPTGVRDVLTVSWHSFPKHFQRNKLQVLSEELLLCHLTEGIQSFHGFSKIKSSMMTP